METIKLKVGDVLLFSDGSEETIMKIEEEDLIIADREFRPPEVYIEFNDGTYCEEDDLQDKEYLFKVNGQDVTDFQVVIEPQEEN